MRTTVSRLSATSESQYTTRMSDGRYIVVSSKPMSNGFIVTTHQDITEQRRSEAKIVHMALHDALTGLPNRVLFNERLDHALARTKRGDIVADPPARPRSLQERQRHAGPSRGRQAAQSRDRASAHSWCARPTPSRAWAATSSPFCRRRSRSRRMPSVLARRVIDVVERALRDRRPSGDHRHERRHRCRADRRRHARPADTQCRPGALSRQGRRPRRVLLLRAGHGRQNARAPRHGIRPAQGAGGWRVRAVTTSRSSISRATRSAASRR